MSPSASAAPPPSAARAGRASLALYATLLAYSSLHPFFGWRMPEANTLFVWPKYLTAFDVGINVAAYVPLGMLVAALWRRRQLHADKPPFGAALASLAVAVGTTAALSLLLEILQLFLPARVASPADWLANVAGGGLGAWAVVSSPGRRMLRALGTFRVRHFAQRAESDWGLIVLALWFCAQTNPAIPFFEAGSIAGLIGDHARTHPYDPLVLLPQVTGIVFNVCAFALFVSVLLHPRHRTLFGIALVMAAGLSVKLAMAALLLKAPQLAASLAPATVIGTIAGLATYVFFAGLGVRWRAFWGALLTFTGALMAKISSVYAALDETLRLFNWPHGQLANFASMTRWVSEIWPLAALIFLCTIFLRSPPSSSKSVQR